MREKKSTMIEIVRTCLEIDVMAVRVYRLFSRLPIPGPVKTVFRTLQEDETRHIAYWKGLLLSARRGTIFEVLEDGEQLLYELSGVAKAALALQQETMANPPADVNGLFLSAIKMEYVLLHPAFIALFNCSEILPGRRSMEDEYVDHIEHLCRALNAQAAKNPMFSLFSELLHRVWQETKRLVKLNQFDELSGALNRRGFHAHIRPLVSLAQRKRFRVAVMVIDIDHFKRINDVRGHQAGDKVIRLVTKFIVKSVRQSDIVARYGGDEFVVFLLDVPPDALAGMALKIKSGMKAQTKRVAPVTVSIGVASREMQGGTDETVASLLKAADAALYKVKRRGRNGYRLCLIE